MAAGEIAIAEPATARADREAMSARRMEKSPSRDGNDFLISLDHSRENND
jgi:hypothetical protein